MHRRRTQLAFRTALALLAGVVLSAGCGDSSSPPAPAPTSTSTGGAAKTATPTQPPPVATATSTHAAAATATSAPSHTPESEATATVTSAAATETPTQPAVDETPTPTATATPPSGSSYVGDYNGTAGTYGTRFHVSADGSAVGTLDFLTGGGASLPAATGGGADISVSYDASGQANLETGAYQLTGSFFGNDFSIGGQLPANPEATGTLGITVFGSTAEGVLYAGTVSLPTPTPSPGCDTADLQMAFSNVSGDFNGDSTNFTVERMNVAVEQKAPNYIPGLNEVFNSTFNGTNCADTRNIQISLYQSPGGLAAGQTFTVGAETGLIANVYYGQVAGGDSVWSSSAGSVVIDSVEGSVVTLHVVDAAMTVPAGNAAGSFTLNVSGQVNNFTRQLD